MDVAVPIAESVNVWQLDIAHERLLPSGGRDFSIAQLRRQEVPVRRREALQKSRRWRNGPTLSPAYALGPRHTTIADHRIEQPLRERQCPRRRRHNSRPHGRERRGGWRGLAPRHGHLGSRWRPCGRSHGVSRPRARRPPRTAATSPPWRGLSPWLAATSFRRWGRLINRCRVGHPACREVAARRPTEVDFEVELTISKHTASSPI